MDAITGPYAVKVCGSEFWRDLIYARQKRAAELGIAPPVGDRINIIGDRGEIRFAYETRVARILSYGWGDEEQLGVMRDLYRNGFNPNADVFSSNAGMWQEKPVLVDWGMGGEEYQEEKEMVNIFKTTDGKPAHCLNTQIRNTYEEEMIAIIQVENERHVPVDRRLDRHVEVIQW